MVIIDTLHQSATLNVLTAVSCIQVPWYPIVNTSKLQGTLVYVRYVITCKYLQIKAWVDISNHTFSPIVSRRQNFVVSCGQTFDIWRFLKVVRQSTKWIMVCSLFPRWRITDWVLSESSSVNWAWKKKSHCWNQIILPSNWVLQCMCTVNCQPTLYSHNVWSKSHYLMSPKRRWVHSESKFFSHVISGHFSLRPLTQHFCNATTWEWNISHNCK